MRSNGADLLALSNQRLTSRTGQFPKWEAAFILLLQAAWSGLSYNLVDSGAAVVSRFWSETGSRFRFCHKSFLHKS